MGQYWEAFSWVDCFINKLKWRKTCQNVISFLEMLKWDDCALYVLSASNTNDFSLSKNPMNWSDQWSTMKCEAVLCVRLKEGEGFPDVQSCHEDQSLKRPPSQTRCIFIPAAVHLYTSPYKHLVPSCSNLCSHFSTPPSSSPQKKDIVTSRLLHNNHFPNDRFPNNNHIRPIPCLFNWLTCLQNANESKS